MSENKLISLLEALIRDIKDGKLSTEEQQFLCTLQNQEEKELIKYMFIGWYLCGQLPSIISP